MNARPSPLPIPTTARYWSVDLGDRGVMHFRFPSFAVASLLVTSVTRHQRDLGIVGGELPQVRLGAYSPVAAAVVGACWWDRASILDVVPLAIGATHAEVLAYGERVVDEWIEDERDLLDLIAAYNVGYRELARRLGLTVRAQEQADFSEGPAPAADLASAAGEESAKAAHSSISSPSMSE